MAYLVSPRQTFKAALQGGCDHAELQLSGVALLTFSKAVMERLEELCLLQESTWVSPSLHPYAGAQVAKRGTYAGTPVTALVPPMGASPLACIIEDLAAGGVQAVFLVCAAWSLGPPVRFGDLMIPTNSQGPDGTSIHYGNKAQQVHAEPEVVEALAQAAQAVGAQVHVGGNATCEALYRITPEMVQDYRSRGCICMENGEANTLFAAAQELGVIGGALFQPYIDLWQGWDPAVLSDARYAQTCRLQAEVVLEAARQLLSR